LFEKFSFDISNIRANSVQIDALREIGNIASSHAATALSKLLDMDISIDITESTLLDVSGLPCSLEKIDNSVFTVYMNLEENNRGIVFMILPMENAIQLSKLFFKNDREKNNSFETEVETEEIVTEIGNICICAYLNAISKFLDLPLIPSPPMVSKDIMDILIEYSSNFFEEEIKYALVLETKLKQDNDIFPGIILYLPDIKSQILIFKKFGIDY
jgi:chemotaxis protein CheC